MPRIEEQIEIVASSSDVFRLCHDAARRPEWDERVVKVEMRSPAPMRRGTLVCIDARAALGGLVFSWEGEYVDFHYPHRSELRVIDAAPSSAFKSGSEIWEISRVGDTTHASLVWEYRPRGIVGTVLDLLGRRVAARRAIRKSLANLKAMAEAV